jgi:hypothetical protein
MAKVQVTSVFGVSLWTYSKFESFKWTSDCSCIIFLVELTENQIFQMD